MNNTYDEYDESIVKDVKVERETKPFELTQLEFTHFYFSSGDIALGMPISTSVELLPYFDSETQKNAWMLTTTHTYYWIDYKERVETTREAVSNELIEELEKIDLRDLKNNYFTDECPERFSSFELAYNYHFKITGTYDQEIPEIRDIARLLNFKKRCEVELEKVNARKEKVLKEDYQ